MKILLVDDDRDLVDLLRYALQRDGYTVVTAFDADAALSVCALESPNVIILDLSMPRRSGLDVLKELRQRAKASVLVLSAHADEENIVTALDLGADDYLTKPFRPRELRARIRALIRRNQEVNAGEIKRHEPLNVGDIHLDPGTREVRVDGQVIHLTRTEFALLQYLMRNHDIVLHPSDIIANVWGYDAEQNEELLRVAISRLRRKIQDHTNHDQYIVNVMGQGYKFSSHLSE